MKAMIKNGRICLNALIFTIWIILGMGCTCKNGAYNNGIIIKEIGNSCTIMDRFNNGLIIDNDSAYYLNFDEKCQPEKIDFSKFTILGNYASGGCYATFIRTVSIDEKNKKYTYLIDVNNCGLCSRAVISYNWVLVPKLPLGWKVEFQKN